MPMRFRRMSQTLLASAALVTASLMVPASAKAQGPYNAWCMQYFKNWCSGHWQAEGFASFSECMIFYLELQCRYDW